MKIKKKILFCSLLFVSCFFLFKCGNPMMGNELEIFIEERNNIEIVFYVGSEIEWLSATGFISSGESGKKYAIIITGNFDIDGIVYSTDPNSKNFTFDSVTGITVTIKPDTGSRTLNLKGTGPSSGSIIRLNNTQTLNIENITLKGVDNNNHSLVYVGDGSQLTMRGLSSITGNKGNGTAYSGGVHVDGGIFIMQGSAKIDNCGTASGGYGGGVYVGNDGTFTMDGGTIEDCEAKYGGGVGIAEGGTFIMNNGTISENTATDDGGGVFVGKGTFTMRGSAKIYECTANMGGGVAVLSEGTFTMRGSAEIYECTAENPSGNGGGVYVGNDGTFTMNGGTISKNIAIDGCGVYVNDGIFTMRGDSTIESNISRTNGNGGGVYLNAGIFDMYGGKILRNDAGTGKGGGLYIAGGNFFMHGGTIYGEDEGENSNTANEGKSLYLASGTAKYGDGTEILEDPETDAVERTLRDIPATGP
ncbi:MAG: hypothetical protein LBU88_07985 [Treponema sp.]|jgi:hypothetical protein|nr:hypothetical protein [Treponema sp.]